MPAQEVNLENVGPQADNTEPVSDPTLDEFFSNLDLQVNRAVFDDAPPVNLVSKDKGEGAKKPSKSADNEEQPEYKKELETLKKRYDDSSREAKRLAEKVRTLEGYERYLPLLDAMKSDPGLINHVRNYLEGSNVPRSLKDELNLGEDFVFDFEEAMTDPSSPSAKLYNASIDRAVQARLNVHNEQERAERARHNQQEAISAFQKSNKISDEQMAEVIDWAREHEITIEDIYYLKNRENREKELVRKTIEAREEQIKKVRGVPPSLGSVGSASNDDVDVNKLVFGEIKKALDKGKIF